MAYGYQQHLKEYGNGENRYRSTTFAQPMALEVGDVLVTGERIAGTSTSGFNGSVTIYVDDGPICGVRGLDVPSRIPLAIRRKR